MYSVCEGKDCPRRWVCQNAEPVPVPAFVIDYRRTGDCCEANSFAMFKRGTRSCTDLVRMLAAVIASHEDLVESIEQSLNYLTQEETY